MITLIRASTSEYLVLDPLCHFLCPKN